MNPGGRFAPKKTTVEGTSTSFDFDSSRPADHPWVSAVDRERIHLAHPGGWDHREREGWVACDSPARPLADRPDVLGFQTEPLERDLETTGPSQGKLWVLTDTPDTDWTDKVVAIPLADGIHCLRFAADPRREIFVTPGRIVRVVAKPYPAPREPVSSGHRVRLDASSSHYPCSEVNPNTGEPLWEHTAVRVAQNT